MPLTTEQVFTKAGKEQIALVRDGLIFYMVLNTKLNMIDMNFINRMNQVLDEIESSDGPGVLVTIASGPTVFCSGFNLKFWAENPWNM